MARVIEFEFGLRAIADLVGGTVQVGLDTVTVVGPQVKAGKLKMIAAGTRVRLPAFPDAPTIAESGYAGFEAVAWVGLTAPAGTPRDWRERVSSEMGKALRDAAFVERLNTIGGVARPMGGDEFGAYLRSEQKRWKYVVERSGVKAD